MAKNTSFNLGSHFEAFVSEQVSAGRFSSASEVMREGLRILEERETKLAALRTELAIGAAQADRGEFVKDFSMAKIQRELDKKFATKDSH